MNAKIFSVFAFAFLAIFTISALVSANLVSSPSSLSITGTQNNQFSVSFVLQNTNATDSVTNIAFSNSTQSNFNLVSLSGVPSSLSNGSSSTVTATYFIKSGTASGTYSSNNLVVTGDNTNTITIPVSITVSQSFCRNGEVGTNLSVSDFEIDNNGEGDDDRWQYLDTIEITATISNDGDSDLREVEAELGIFDSEGKNIVDDFEFIGDNDENVDLGRIDEGDEEDVTFEIKVPADIDTEDYRVEIKAVSNRVSESELCAQSSSETISVESEDDEDRFIAFDNIEFTPSEATCLDNVIMSFDVFNVGEDDEDQVKVRLFSRELGLDLTQEIDNLDQGDSQSTFFEFRVPQGLADRTYTLELDAEYTFDNGDYENSLEETKKVPFRVFGCGISGTPSANQSAIGLTASLDSDVEAGEELAVNIVVKNNNVNPSTFVIDVRGYSDWARLESISERSIYLQGGESRTIQLVLMPNADVSGEQTFNIDVQSNGRTQSKQVIVDFPAESSANFFKDNKLAWIIGLVNLILIILIIIVAVKVSKS